jgi:Saxitoxin biosynthesis operon protein SxtJ
MAAGIPTRLSSSEGRKFGLTVGAVFLVLALISWWRGHGIVSAVLGFVGGGLSLAGLVLPTWLGPVFQGWMGLARAISRVTTPVFMGIIYFAVIFPTGLIMRMFGRNPLRRKEKGGSFWVPRAPDIGQTRSMKRQF